MKADPKTEAAVIAVIERLDEAYAARDLKAVLALHAPDKDLVIIGTGADEVCRGFEQMKAAYQRDFAEAQGVSMEWRWRSVSARDNVAWVAGGAVVRAEVQGKKLELPVRFTAVLEKRGDEWLLVHTHNSMAAPGLPEGKSYPTS